MRMARAGADVVGTNCYFDPRNGVQSTQFILDAYFTLRNVTAVQNGQNCKTPKINRDESCCSSTTLKTLALMKEGLAEAGLLDRPTYLMAQPVGFHCPDATTKLGYSYYTTSLDTLHADFIQSRLLQDFPNPGTRDSPSSPPPWSRACTRAGTCTGSPGRPTSWACATSAAAAASSRTTSGQSPRSCRPRGAERDHNLYDVCITLIHVSLRTLQVYSSQGKCHITMPPSPGGRGEREARPVGCRTDGTFQAVRP